MEMKPATLILCAGAGSVTIQAAASAPSIPSFEMIAYTGGSMILPGYNLPVVIDLAGLTIPDQRRPILRDHRAWKVVGHSEEILNDGLVLRARGKVSGTGLEAKEVRENARNGFPWQASVGAIPDPTPGAIEFVEAGMTVLVNSQTFTGPLYVARRTTLREISFVPIGADGNTVASIAAQGATQMTFEQWCLGFMTIDEFQALDETAKSALQKAFDFVTGAAVETPADETIPSDMPAAAPVTAAARPAWHSAGATAIQVGTNGIQAARQELAAEHNRVAAIRKLCASAPDAETEIPIGGQKRKVNILAHAIEAGWSPEQTSPWVEIAGIRSNRQGGTFGYGASGTPAVTPVTLEAALCRTLRLPNIEKYFKPEVLEASERQFKSLGLQRILLMTAAQNGYHVGPGERISNGNIKGVLEAAFSTISLPGILSNTANKEILEGYMEEDQSWKEVGAVRSSSDFKATTSYRMLDSLEYEKVGPAGEIKHGSMDEESYSRQIETYAKMLVLTRQMVINDDLSAFADLRPRLGQGAMRKFNNVFWTEFLSNASTFWTTARTNFIEGATTNLGTDGVGLGLGVAAFRRMTSPASLGASAKRIGGQPNILLVPPELAAVAEQLFEARNSASVKVSDVNIHAGKYRVVVVPWLSDPAFTGYSTTAWYLLRSPSIAPAVVASFLNGNQSPTIEDAEADFHVLGIQFRGFHDFGVDQADYLAGVKVKGAA